MRNDFQNSKFSNPCKRISRFFNKVLNFESLVSSMANLHPHLHNLLASFVSTYLLHVTSEQQHSLVNFFSIIPQCNLSLLCYVVLVSLLFVKFEKISNIVLVFLLLTLKN